MANIGVIGMGPVGLAMADRAKRRGHVVTLFGRSQDRENTADSLSWRFSKSNLAAAAFWTPFCSGCMPKKDADLSKLTLEFYQQLIASNKRDAARKGLSIRTIEQHFLRSHFAEPEWKDLPGLAFNFAETDKFEKYTIRETCASCDLTQGQTLEIKKEFSYKAPVIQAGRFISWYAQWLIEDQEIHFVDIEKPFVGIHHNKPDLVEFQNYWKNLVQQHSIEKLIVCTGGSTFFGQIIETERWQFSPKKGCVAHIPRVPNQRDAVILFEGGVFDRETLYIVPLIDRYLLGGTVHPVSSQYSPRYWEVTDEERRDIASRASQLLPDKYKKIVNSVPKDQWTWLAAPRPLISDHGPICEHSVSLSKIYETGVYLNCGHGGSGFTFCHDTAEQILAIL